MFLHTKRQVFKILVFLNMRSVSSWFLLQFVFIFTEVEMAEE